jgi:hypothetical protein
MRAGGARNAQAALVARAHYAPVTPAWPGLIHASSMTVSRAGAEGPNGPILACGLWTPGAWLARSHRPRAAR